MQPKATALALANDRFQTINAKTTHGLVRGPSRYDLVGVVDASSAGQDAGALLDGEPRGIPISASVAEALEKAERRPAWCVVGVATPGGKLPDALRQSLREAAEAGLSIVNGLHVYLSDDPELGRIVAERGGEIVDLRKPRPARDLRFWTGEILDVQTPRVAVLGTDCAIGKRTTCMKLLEALRGRDVRAEMVYTGQTGWLQGLRYGFIFDSTINDFVSGELERAVLECERETSPDVILLEGQSSLRNPSGPCGSEFIVSAGAKGVILQHMPGRPCYEGMDRLGYRVRPIKEEVELVRLLGAEVWAVALATRGLAEAEVPDVRARLQDELGLPVVLPLEEGAGALADVVQGRIGVAVGKG